VTEGGELRGQHPAGDLRLFLSNHGVPAADVEAVHAMLLAQASGEPDFATRCGGCHGTAAALARDRLEVRDGLLVGRGSGRPVAAFLQAGHAGLTPEDAARLTEVLARVEREVHRP
jgi:hypothetical protein